MVEHVKILICVLPNVSTGVELHESSIIRGLGCMVVQMYDGLVAWWFSFTGVQWHGSSVTRGFS
jgi:hypothetical protein